MQYIIRSLYFLHISPMVCFFVPFSASVLFFSIISLFDIFLFYNIFVANGIVLMYDIGRLFGTGQWTQAIFLRVRSSDG